jgi:hypothetical protein
MLDVIFCFRLFSYVSWHIHRDDTVHGVRSTLVTMLATMLLHFARQTQADKLTHTVQYHHSTLKNS